MVKKQDVAKKATHTHAGRSHQIETYLSGTHMRAEGEIPIEFTIIISINNNRGDTRP